MYKLPSTPDSQRTYRDDDPSTTPANPPPTGYTAHSFTPAGPPPSSVFGSSVAPSNFNNFKPAFGPSGHVNSPSLQAPMHTNPFAPISGFSVPDSSPPPEGQDDFLEDAEGEEDFDIPGVQRSIPALNGFTRNGFHQDAPEFLESPRSAKRARNGEVMAASMRSSRLSKPQREKKSTFSGIAKGLAAGIQDNATPQEEDDLVLDTESLLSSLETSIKTLSPDEAEDAVVESSRRLLQEWSKYTNKESLPAAIGPVDKSGLTRAEYIASLLFQLHHPTSTEQPQQAKTNGFSRASRFTNTVATKQATVPIPKALIEWLNIHHNPYPEDLPEVIHCKPSPTAHERFWDTIFAVLLRGNINMAVQLLQNANFAHADTALEDGYEEPGYKGKQLEAVQTAVAQCIDLLQSCPAYADEDWDVKNTDWSIFRNRVRRTMEDLEDFAEEGNAAIDNQAQNVFQSSRLGTSFSASSRRAMSKVPWTIYEQLKTLYGQLLGSREEIMLSAQDWLEAAIYLTAWWDGEDDSNPKGNLGASTRSMRQFQHTREVDVSPVPAYKRRLLAAFDTVTDKPEEQVLSVNTIDPVQVALACVCEDDIGSVISLLRKWSIPIAAAVVDVASAGGWLPDSGPRSGGVMDGFDQSDLMVLSHGQAQQKDITRDEILGQYANTVAQKAEFKSSDGKTVKEGWAMAVRILSRLDSADAAQHKISAVFEEMSFDSTERVDKALAVCNELGLAGQVRTISERYANSLAESTHSYGQAIVYYARARSIQQLRNTLDLLISMSLVQSAAYPPTSQLDAQLDELLNDQRQALNQLARVDVEAAQLIANHLSGYATLRRFYDLRDENEDNDDSRRSGLRPFARKREAAKAIVALIESAADTIRGGLYDSEIAAVVQIDTLLALLGEALPLMNHSKPLLKQAHLMSLLRATEDLQTVSSRVYSQAETLFQAAMSDFRGTQILSPADLTKSLSASNPNLAGSAFAMVNSNGSLESEPPATNGSREEIYRGWDWRAGVETVEGKKATGEAVLRILRIQVAREMARAWSEEV